MNSVLVAVLVFACIVMITAAQNNNTATESTSSALITTTAKSNVTSTKAPGAACNIQTSGLLLLIAAIFSWVF